MSKLNNVGVGLEGAVYLAPAPNPAGPNPNDQAERQRSLSNLARIQLIVVAATNLLEPQSQQRHFRLLLNRAKVNPAELPQLLLAAHSDEEAQAAHTFKLALSHLAEPVTGEVRVIRQKGHNETVGHALSWLGELFPDASLFERKRQMLYLSRRGGKGKPQFISPFTGGEGTTCATWTRKVATNAQGEALKGFVKANVCLGFCPVECPFCYLMMTYTQSMEIALNWQDLRTEILTGWGYQSHSPYTYPSTLAKHRGWSSMTTGLIKRTAPAAWCNI